MKLNFRQYLFENAEISINLNSFGDSVRTLLAIYQEIEVHPSIDMEIKQRLINLLGGESGLFARITSYYKRTDTAIVKVSRQDLVVLKAKFLELSSIAKLIKDHKISHELDQLCQAMIRFIVVKLTNEKQDTPQEYILKNGEKLIEYVKLHFSMTERCFKLIGVRNREQFKTSCLNKIEVAQDDYIRFYTRNSIYIAKLSPKDIQKIAPAMKHN